MTTQARPLQLGIAIAAALAGLALAGCNKPDTPPEQKVSAGTELDDAVITTKVKSALMTDNLAKGGDTSVETRKGEVLLSGFVDDQAQADREVQLAKAVEGVSSVQNKLMIKDGKSTAGAVLDDSVVTVKVKSALMTDDQTKGTEIAVTTNKGVVQLSGFVNSPTQRSAAERDAWSVRGVKDVSDNLIVK